MCHSFDVCFTNLFATNAWHSFYRALLGEFAARAQQVFDDAPNFGQSLVECLILNVGTISISLSLLTLPYKVLFHAHFRLIKIINAHSIGKLSQYSLSLNDKIYFDYEINFPMSIVRLGVRHTVNISPLNF